MLHHRPDRCVDAICSRCIRASGVVDSADVLVELGWELRPDGQTWCVDCSAWARTPKGRPNQRGVVRRRRR